MDEQKDNIKPKLSGNTNPKLTQVNVNYFKNKLKSKLKFHSIYKYGSYGSEPVTVRALMYILELYCKNYCC